MIKKIYLDNAATTPLLPEVKNYVVELLDTFYNPSSLYQGGFSAKKIINSARENVAKFIGCNSDEITFTSGGSASNTLAISGFLRNNNYMLLYSPIAHKSILKQTESINKKTFALKVNSYGEIDIDDLKNWLSSKIGNFLVAMDYANSEIGTVQDVKKIISLVHSYDGIVYLDCTGSIGQIPINVKHLDVDMIGFSAHKLGALKGCGVLYKKNNIELEPLIYGSQENGLFSGTENVIGIASLGKAIENYDYSCIKSFNRDYVYNYIINNIPDTYVIGKDIESTNRLPYNLYICFKNLSGESLMILLDLNGIQVSTGSACTSSDNSPSTTLTAIGLKNEDIDSCIRMSFSGKETKEELDHVCSIIKKCVEQLR